MNMVKYVVYRNSVSYQTIHLSLQTGHWCENVVDMEVSETAVALNVSNSTTTPGPVPVRQKVFDSHTELIFDYCIYRGIVLP